MDSLGNMVTVLVYSTAYNLWTFIWFVQFELPFRLKGTDKIHTEGLSKFHSYIYIWFSLDSTYIRYKYQRSKRHYVCWFKRPLIKIIDLHSLDLVDLISNVKNHWLSKIHSCNLFHYFWSRNALATLQKTIIKNNQF